MQDEFATGFGGEITQMELPRAGAHQAVCCQVHSLGIQYYKGQPDLNPTGVFVFELEEKLTQGPKAGQPFVISERFSQYMGSPEKQSKLRAFLQSWVGSKPEHRITDEKAKVMNIKAWEKYPCTLIISHVPHKTNPWITVAKLVGIGPRDTAGARVPVTYTETPKWITKAKEEARAETMKRGGFDPQDRRPDRNTATVPPGAAPTQAPAADNSARAAAVNLSNQVARAADGRILEDDLPF